MDNANSRDYLDKIRVQVLENVRRTMFAPSVQLTDVPRDSMAMNDEDEAEMDDLDEDQNPDKRNTQHRFDKYVEKSGELSDSDDEELNEANGVRKQPGVRKRRNRLDYRNLTDYNGDSAITSGAGTPQAASSLPDNDVEDELMDDVDVAAQANGVAATTAAQPNQESIPDGDVEMKDAAILQAPQPTTPAPAAIPAATSTQHITPPESPPHAPATNAVSSPPQAAEPADPVAETGAAVKEERGSDESAPAVSENIPVEKGEVKEAAEVAPQTTE